MLCLLTATKFYLSRALNTALFLLYMQAKNHSIARRTLLIVLKVGDVASSMFFRQDNSVCLRYGSEACAYSLKQSNSTVIIIVKDKIADSF